MLNARMKNGQMNEWIIRGLMYEWRTDDEYVWINE